MFGKKPETLYLIMEQVSAWRKLLGLAPNEGPTSWDALFALINNPIQIVEVEEDVPGVHSRPPNEELVEPDIIPGKWGSADIDLSNLVGWVDWKEFVFSAIEWFWFETGFMRETWVRAEDTSRERFRWKDNNDFSEMHEHLKLGFNVLVGGVLQPEKRVKHGGWQKAKVKKPYFCFINASDRVAFHKAKIEIPF